MRTKLLMLFFLLFPVLAFGQSCAYDGARKTINGITYNRGFKYIK